MRRDQDPRLSSYLLTEFRPNDCVRLLDRHGDVPSGTRGRIIGTFGETIDRRYIVRFEREGTCVTDVHFDDIVLAHDVRCSA